MTLGARKRVTTSQAVTLEIELGNTLPPDSFCIFTAGKVETTKGEFIFDDQAAQLVMADYRKHGVDLMIDYAHASLSPLVVDPALSGKAAAWFGLEVKNGELWAVNVRWNEPASAALSRKEWRYMSPAFETDEDGRIISVINVALTNIPATHNLEPLVAASKNALSEGDNSMTHEQFAAIAEALGLGADANVEDVVATISAMVKKITDAANGDGDPEDQAEPAEGTPAAAAASAPPVVAATKLSIAIAMLAKLSGKSDVGALVAEIETWHKSHLEVEAKTAKLAKDREVLETSERKKLVGELVTLGSETPGTAWEDPTEKADKQMPAEPWASMALDKLRARVAGVRAAKGKTAPLSKTTPAAGETSRTIQVEGVAVELSAVEIKKCNDRAKGDAKLAEEITVKYATIKLRQGRTAPVTLEG